MVGAGPAGLSCAYQLPGADTPSPSSRPSASRAACCDTAFRAIGCRGSLDAEIQSILDLGVELRCNSSSGRTFPWAAPEEYQAVFVGIGAHKGLKLG